MRAEAEEADGVLQAERAEDEVAIFEGDEAEEEGAAVVDGVEGGVRSVVVGERGVVAVNDDNGADGEQRVHGFGLFAVKRDGDVALPVDALRCGTGTVVAETGGGQAKAVGAIVLDGGTMQNFGGRSDGDEGGFRGAGRKTAIEGVFKGDDLLDGDILRGEDAVKAFEGEEAAAVEDVGDVGLTEPGLARK